MGDNVLFYQLAAEHAAPVRLVFLDMLGGFSRRGPVGADLDQLRLASDRLEVRGYFLGRVSRRENAEAGTIGFSVGVIESLNAEQLVKSANHSLAFFLISKEQKG